MATRGRRPKPTRLKMLCGNPGKRALNNNEPKPALGAPAPPEWLDPLAREEWDRVVPRLEAVGLLTQVDGFVLEAYCACYSQWVRHEQIIARTGTVYQPSSKKGSKYLQQTPHVSIARQYLDETRALASELGLTPSSRTRLAVPDMDYLDDPMAKLMKSIELEMARERDVQNENCTEKNR